MSKRAKTQKLRTFEKLRARNLTLNTIVTANMLAQRIASDPEKLAAFLELIAPAGDVSK